MSGGWVYVLTNKPNGILYTGVTADLSRRVWQHRSGLSAYFTKRYSLNRLVWCEFHESIEAAIQKERNMKHWPRTWKVRLVLAMNPDWDDLYETINQ
ncbi:GIY-YIG nuclease family protein [Methyloligella sp. GL2]|uniref:GIY-YIG nuclease family protein n=2 Tax=unclassified Methyloligella TaxID=2625955 RepID=UPI00157D88BA|nr:GIY-YIG nuclease family protein [Methyloligella sp. GL2]QKP78628.1 GIY-YIG nuclease family protein [Methyloligella sp. GL2]